MPLERMILICPHIHTSICFSFIPLEFIEHQLCELLIVKDLLAEEQIRARTTKMLVGHQATGWLMMQAVFFPQRECYSYSLYCIEKFEKFYTITKLCCSHNFSSWFHVLASSITFLAVFLKIKYFYYLFVEHINLRIGTRWPRLGDSDKACHVRIDTWHSSGPELSQAVWVGAVIQTDCWVPPSVSDSCLQNPVSNDFPGNAYTSGPENHWIRVHIRQG